MERYKRIDLQARFDGTDAYQMEGVGERLLGKGPVAREELDAFFMGEFRRLEYAIEQARSDFSQKHPGINPESREGRPYFEEHLSPYVVQFRDSIQELLKTAAMRTTTDGRRYSIQSLPKQHRLLSSAVLGLAF